MEGERERDWERERERDRDLEGLWAGSGEGGEADLLVLEDRLADSFDLGSGEELLPAGEALRERERLWDLAGLRERLGERDGERPRDRDREREELSDLERLLDLRKREHVLYYTMQSDFSIS